MVIHQPEVPDPDFLTKAFGFSFLVFPLTWTTRNLWTQQENAEDSAWIPHSSSCIWFIRYRWDDKLTDAAIKSYTYKESHPSLTAVRLRLYFLNVPEARLLFLPTGRNGSVSRRQPQQLDFSDQTFVVHKSFLHKTPFRASDQLSEDLQTTQYTFFQSTVHSTNEILLLA